MRGVSANLSLAFFRIDHHFWCTTRSTVKVPVELKDFEWVLCIKGLAAPLNSGNANSNANNGQSKASGQKKEDKIELAFKVKRANIFTEGVDLGRSAYVEKKVPKTAKQTKTILWRISNYFPQ